MKTAVLTFFVLISVFCPKDTIAPTVINTVPANGDRNVAPGPTVLTVTFSEAMQRGNYSWAYTTPESFPKINGEPSLKDNGHVATLPVILAPNTEYEIWINSEKFTNFKDLAGNTAVPYKLVFKTR